MGKSIKDLKNLWAKEQTAYKHQEVGSGVQKFVKAVLKCEGILNLKEGKLSTPNEKRTCEFLEEKPKKGRRGDVIIFIDSDRVIPMEIERLGNIEAGENQLFNYQRDWDKKYGILTDGYNWRFYNNTLLVKSFILDSMLDNTTKFLEFWNEYVQPENYYLHFFEKIGQLELFEEDRSVENNIENFFADTTTLIKSFKNKLNIKGYFDRIGEEESEKRSVEITYAYLIQFILYKTLVDNDFKNFKEDFDKRLERIYKNLKNKNYSDILNAIKAISDIISQNIYRPFSEEQNFINNKLEDILIKPQNRIEEVSSWLDIFILIKRYNFANIKNEIFGYVYENYLKDVYSEEKKGQYFTDPAIVDFMIEQIGFTPNNIKKRVKDDPDSISLIDPACGSGTFLYSVIRNIIEALPNGSYTTSKKIEELVNKNIFGLDIEEFPLYLAEMSIIMRMLPLIINERYNNPIEKKIKVFKTKDSIAEFLDTAIRNTPSAGAIERARVDGLKSLFCEEELNLGYTSYVRDEDDLRDMKRSLEDQPHISRYRFDYVIGNPPYISYNECAQQRLKIFDLIKERKNKLKDVYGMNLHSVPNNKKKYRPNPNLWAFFIALGIALLKEKGKICYIIPQTLLVNSDFDVIRFHLSKYVTIEKIITFSGKMFVGRGIKQDKPVATSSLIFVARRELPKKEHKVKVKHYKDASDNIKTCLDNIAKGEKLISNEIYQTKLLENLDNWSFIKLSDKVLDFYEQYRQHGGPIDEYYQHDKAKNKFGDTFYFDGGYGIKEKEMLDAPLKGFLNYKIPILDKNFWTIKHFRGFWPNIREPNKKYYIPLRQCNQGYSLLDKNYKLIWSYNNTEHFFYTEENIIWAMNKYLGVSSNNKQEIEYLFALLNSPVTSFYLNEIIKIANEERRTLLVSLQTIKDQIRIPKINKDNEYIKKEIIEQVDNLINEESIVLSDIVEFSDIMIQKFDNLYLSSNKLILAKEGKQIECDIIDKEDLIKNALSGYKRQLSQGNYFSLNEIKAIPVIDIERQKALKNHIDDLVFSLYFNIPIKNTGVEYATKIKEICVKNIYYNLIGGEKKERT